MNTIDSLVALAATPSSFRDTAIVPGDMIKPKTKQDFDERALLKALDKRYRGQPEITAQELQQALKADSLHDAVEYLKDQLVSFVGHDRNVILTPKELKERALRSEAQGIMTGLMNCLATGTASEGQIRLALRQQISVRRIDRDAEYVAHCLIRGLADNKHIAIGLKNNQRVWVVVKNNPLDPAQYVDFYKKALRLDLQ